MGGGAPYSLKLPGSPAQARALRVSLAVKVMVKGIPAKHTEGALEVLHATSKMGWVLSQYL